MQSCMSFVFREVLSKVFGPGYRNRVGGLEFGGSRIPATFG